MKVEEFWDSRDVEERRAVLDAIKEKYGKEILRSAVKAVSYTHLTLPTIYSV